jgi:hypothetical protein
MWQRGRLIVAERCFHVTVGASLGFDGGDLELTREHTESTDMREVEWFSPHGRGLPWLKGFGQIHHKRFFCSLFY